MNEKTFSPDLPIDLPINPDIPLDRFEGLGLFRKDTGETLTEKRLGSGVSFDFVPRDDENPTFESIIQIENRKYNKSISISAINDYENTIKNEYKIEKKYSSLGRAALNLSLERLVDFEPVVESSPGFYLSMPLGNDLRLGETESATTDRERTAHKFRSTRMRIGTLGDITKKLQDGAKAALKSGVSRVVRKSDEIIDGTQDVGERHRLYSPLVTALYADSETRELLISGIDENVKAETEALKAEAKAEEGNMTVNWMVIGSGVHGAIASSELRSLLPNQRIVMVDKSLKAGGQFANYGKRPVFYGNSRANRRQQKGTIELPGSDGNINSFGPHAPVQLPDLTSNTYWTNVEMGDAVKLNGYLSAEAMQTTDVTKVEYVPDIDGGYYKVEMKDLDTGDLMSMKVKNIVVTAGLGERIALASPENKAAGYYSAEDLLARFADPENYFPMEEFVDKKVAVIGGGDSARISLELFARLAPDEAYGKSKVQFGNGPEDIDWFGVEFSDRSGFVSTTRPRYSQLASFIDRERGDGLIHPKPNTKVTRIEPTEDGQVTVFYRGENGKEVSNIYDYVVDATTLVSKASDPFDSIDGNPVTVSTSRESRVSVGVYTRNSRTLGKQLNGHRIVFAGPVAKSPLTPTEQATFAMGIRENTAAIWANGPRTVELMQRMASRSRK